VKAWGFYNLANKGYLELFHLIERLHRLFLDVLRVEIKKLGIRDLNGVQAMLLANIGDQDVVIRDLIERGYYQGSNVSYNVKKLTDIGYLEQRRMEYDKRSVSLKLTDKAKAVVAHIQALDAEALGRVKIDPDGEEGVEEARETLRQLEQSWSEYVRYGK